MDDISYAAFTRGIQELNLGKRALVEVSLEVTRRCPLRCRHCYNNLSLGDAGAREEELTLDEYRRLLDEIVQAGCLWLVFTGGEPFARRDFLDIYECAKSKGLLITIFTNGTLITPRTADFLAQWPPLAIEVTLYGATRETYERSTQVPGSFDRCMRGIRLLRERNLPLKLKTVPTRINRHEVFEMQRMAEQEFGVSFKFDPFVNPRIDCSQGPLEVRLSTEEAVALDFSDARRRREYARLLEREWGQAAGNPEPGHVYSCGGGMNSCAVDPAGLMSICVLSQRDRYNWRTGSFMEGWNGFLAAARTKKKTRQTKCDTCRIQALCGMCPANGELENGDAESPVEFLCEAGHLRALVLGVETPPHGECECCPGGRRHGALVEAAGRIRGAGATSWRPAAACSGLRVLQDGGECASARGPRGGEQMRTSECAV